jgi:hypothetical protein
MKAIPTNLSRSTDLAEHQVKQLLGVIKGNNAKMG